MQPTKVTWKLPSLVPLPFVFTNPREQFLKSYFPSVRPIDIIWIALGNKAFAPKLMLNTIKSYLGVFLLYLINAIQSPEVIYQLSIVPAKEMLEWVVTEVPGSPPGYADHL